LRDVERGCGKRGFVQEGEDGAVAVGAAEVVGGAGAHTGIPKYTSPVSGDASGWLWYSSDGFKIVSGVIAKYMG